MRSLSSVALLATVALVPALAWAGGPAPSTPACVPRTLPALSVEVPGTVAAGDPIDLVVRPAPGCFRPVTRVVAVLWTGYRIDLGVALGGGGWYAEVETPATLPPGRYPIRIVAGDGTGHRVARTVRVRVSSRRLAFR